MDEHRTLKNHTNEIKQIYFSENGGNDEKLHVQFYSRENLKWRQKITDGVCCMHIGIVRLKHQIFTKKIYSSN